VSDQASAKRAGAKGPLTLRAGPVEVVFEDGALHSLTALGVEVWRGVMFLYRDAAWRTPAVVLSNLEVAAQADSFSLAFDGVCSMTPSLLWHARVDGSASGSIRFDVEARPEAELLTNRTGVCVLHPLSAAGARVEIEHTDGRLSRSSLPVLISPWQPFTNIRAVRHEFMPGCWANCRMEGDVFEMEDQRNFSDASYKTYSGSNLRAMPYRLAPGDCVRQSAVLTLERCAATPRSRDPRGPSIDVTATRSGRLPRLGLTYAPEAAARSIRPALWHVSIDRRAARETLDEVGRIRDAAATAPVAVELLLRDETEAEHECRELAEQLAVVGAVPESIAVFPTSPRSVSAARAAFPRSAIGGGTPWFFTHLNRSTLPDGLDFVTFRTCPIVHVADDRAVMQTLATLPAIVTTLRARSPQAAMRVGPSSISMTVNPFGAWPEPIPGTPLAMARADSRDEERLGVAWSVGYLAGFASGGAEVVSFSSVHAFQALAWLAPLADARMRTIDVSDDRVVALALETPSGIEIVITNCGDQPVDVSVRMRGQDRRVQTMAAFDFARVTFLPADGSVTSASGP
jgi:D-apionolactonase